MKVKMRLTQILACLWLASFAVGGAGIFLGKISSENHSKTENSGVEIAVLLPGHTHSGSDLGGKFFKDFSAVIPAESYNSEHPVVFWFTHTGMDFFTSGSLPGKLIKCCISINAP